VIALDRNLRGIVAIVASQLAFLLNDTFIKVTSERLPLGEIIFLRGVFATLLVGGGIVALGLHRQLPSLMNQFVAWRTCGELGGTFFYLLALFQMPIATATIIFQAVPLTVTGGAALFLDERVGWRRWAAIGVGFLGVVIVIRPGLDSFDAFGILVLISVLFVSLRDLATRAVPSAIPTLLMTFLTACAVTFMGVVIGFTETWVMPSVPDLLRLAGAGIFLAIGYFTAIAAMRLGDMSVTAPFRYVAVVFAIAIGFLVWGDVPDALTILGSLIIVGTGLYTLYRERRTKPPGAPLIAAPAAIDPPTGG
jgi:drug/metabolite transporter (DMT)-like permease